MLRVLRALGKAANELSARSTPFCILASFKGILINGRANN